MARELTESKLQPAAQGIADRAVPLAKSVTEGQIQPGARAVAEKVRLPVACSLLSWQRLFQFILCGSRILKLHNAGCTSV